MAVPGPVTSVQSAGCHEIVRNWGAVLVTSAADVMDLTLPVGEEPATPRRGPVLPRDALDEVTRAVLEAVPARRGAGPAAIAVAAEPALTPSSSASARWPRPAHLPIPARLASPP